MKLLLTSGGLTNKSMADALLDLVGKPFSESNIAFIPTAANVKKGHKNWFIRDLVALEKLGFKQIDIVDISALPKDVWEPRLREADVLLFEGGNTFHLMYWVKKSGLMALLPELLQSRVYLGISAGSIITSHSISVSTSEQYYSEEIGKQDDMEGLGYVNFHIRPHLNNAKIKKELVQEMADKLKEPIYAIDDQTAIKVVDEKVDIITEGEYLKFNQ